jgi:uncharacterized protein
MAIGAIEESGSDAALVEVLTNALPEATVIYRFGSTASGDSHPGSDVDLAVLAPRPIAPGRLARAREEVAEIVRRDVDLVDIANVSTVLQAQIVSKGRVLKDADPSHRERFETTVYSAYAHLNEERREILDRIQSEGRIRGR